MTRSYNKIESLVSGFDIEPVYQEVGITACFVMVLTLVTYDIASHTCSQTPDYPSGYRRCCLCDEQISFLLVLSLDKMIIAANKGMG